MSSQSAAIVQRLWNYCNVLRDDGVSNGDYVEQLTYLLFLKDGRRAGAGARQGQCHLRGRCPIAPGIGECYNSPVDSGCGTDAAGYGKSRSIIEVR